ncbi:MAG: zinc ABC transporter substrate-binding protein, partial [Pseudomonadales bacterium]|nr:zinc ABC transporter substrate-binding protein [Pseudomonadales bacterium]
AAAVMEGAGEPVLALGPGQDPHEIALRPSERRRLAEADLVLWIGPALELPLADILADDDPRLLTVQAIGGLELLPAGNTVDPHLWLHLGNAQKIAQALAARLSTLDPANAARYADNQARFSQSLAALRAATQDKLAATPLRAWVVYHHAFRYVEQELGLPPPFALTDSSGNMAGLRSLIALREELRRADLNCLLAEPGVDAAKVRNLLDLPALRLQEVDILGNTETPGMEAYARLYLALIDSILACGVSG